MVDVEQVQQLIRLVLIVAIFLINTKRARKAIELCMECLNLL